MDWKAIACHLAQGHPPNLLLDRSLRVHAIDERLAKILCIDSTFEGGLALEEIPELAPLDQVVVDAFTRAPPIRGTCSVTSRTGANVELSVQATRIDEGDKAIVHLSVHSAVVRANRPTHHSATPIRFLYEIRDDLTDFGRLHQVAIDGDVAHYWQADGPRCHELLHACSTPCTDCPVLPRYDRAPTTVRHDDSGHLYEIVRSEPSRERIRLIVHRVGRTDLTAIKQAWIVAAFRHARLTPTEADALANRGEGVARRELAQALQKLRARGLAKLFWLLV